MIVDKKYLKPDTVEKAIRIAKENLNDFRFIAGGTDVLVNKFQGNADTKCLIDISEIDELTQVCKNGENLIIGSLVKLDDLKNHSEIMKNFPALVEAAYSVASPMLRKTATIGGNILCENRCSFYNQSEWWREAVGYCLKCSGDICIATGGKNACFSKFVSDTAPVLISLNAKIEIIDFTGTSIIPLEKIYSGDGIEPINLPKEAIIKFVLIQLDERYKIVFKKLRPREAVDFTSLTTAVSVSDSGKIRIVIGGVDPKPVIVNGTTVDKKEELIRQAVKKARIVDNDYYSRTYRKDMISVFLENSFAELEGITFN